MPIPFKDMSMAVFNGRTLTWLLITPSWSDSSILGVSLISSLEPLGSLVSL